MTFTKLYLQVSFSCLLLFFSTPCFASDSYSLPDLVDMALASRPEMRIASSELSESENLLKEAKSYYYPELNLDVSYSHLNEKPFITVPETTVNAGVDLSGIKTDYPILAAIPDSITVPITVPRTRAYIAGQEVFRVVTELKQPLFTGGKIKERVRQGRYLTDVRRSQETRSADEIATQVDALYFQLVFAERALKVVEAAESRLKVVTKFLENLYKNYTPEAGEKGVDKADYLKSRYVLSKVHVYRSEVVKLRDEARRTMMIACGLTNDDFRVADDAEKYAHRLPTEDMEGLKEIAIANRPEMRQLGLSVNISSSDVKRARAGYVPDIGIFGHYRRMEDNYAGDQKNFMAVGVGASVPVFNGLRTKSEIEKAKAVERKVRSQKELMELKIALEVETLHNKLTDCLRKIEIGNSALEHARARRQLESESYLEAAEEYEDYLEALEDEVTAELMLFRTKAEYYTTLSELHLALGL